MCMIKSSFLAFVAVAALCVVVAAAALATPEFKGKGTAIHFKGRSLLTVIKGDMRGIEDSIVCHKGQVEGLILVSSKLIDKLLLTLNTNCELTIPAIKEERHCNEPIRFKPLMGTLGFLNKAAVPVGLLLSPEGNAEFFRIRCEEEATFVGELVGEFPEADPFIRENQYNKDLPEYAFVFQASGTAQHWTTFELSENFMEKVEDKSEGFLDEKFSVEGTELIELAEAGLIET